MDYKTASAFYAQRLKSALDVQRHAYALVQLQQTAQAGVTDEHKDKLKKAAIPAQTLMHRLELGEFRIAVVGLEKAGKSTFVNAWLGCDLLPAKQERCTFTTTQIYSVQQKNQQRLETQPKPATGLGSFAEYQAELKAQTQSADISAKQTAEKDLLVISEHINSLNDVIAEGTKTFPFNRLEEIKEDLNKYVADERYAHAMHEARLYTQELAAVDGVVFFDVPGLNSGLSKHIEETKKILADCDAIVVIQSRTISLQAHEQDVVKFGEGGDPYLKLADKLFVFWGQIDLQPSQKVLDENWQKLISEWAKWGIPEKRMVRGSAGAHLVLHGAPIDQVGHIDEVTRKMQLITGLISEAELKQATGIAQLQQKVKDYLDHERAELLQKRCDAMLQDIVGTADDVYRLVKQRYPEDPEQAQRLQADQRNMRWGEWWKTRWEQIEADVNNLFKAHLVQFEQKADDQGLQQFKTRYEKLVAEEMAKLPARQDVKRQQIFDANSRKGFNPEVANADWREALHEDIKEMLKRMSKGMALELQNESEALVEELKKLLWDSNQVIDVLIPDVPQYLKDLERSLNTLFLRFARPIVDLLIFHPVHSKPREEMRDRLGVDIEIIDNYYSGEEPAFKSVARYAKRGPALLLDKNLRHEILGNSGEAVKFVLKFHPLGRAGIKMAKIAGDIIDNVGDALIDDQNAVLQEVESDLQAFEHYLLHGIFTAAGFQAFCLQELEDLRDTFFKNAWEGLARNEWEKGNSLLLQELPAELQQQKFDTVISDKLKQLGIALQTARH